MPPVIAVLNATKKWLKDATDDIRNERLAPLAEQARAIWRMLRQDSNVDLGVFLPRDPARQPIPFPDHRSRKPSRTLAYA
jgi:hypothetical protein